jgi:DNA-3-methyladenine glycosylase II
MKTLDIPIIQKPEEGFADSMCHIILEQQVSIESARACYAKLSVIFRKNNSNFNI